MEQQTKLTPGQINVLINALVKDTYSRTKTVKSGSPIVTKFLFDESLLIKDGSLKVLTFDKQQKNGQSSFSLIVKETLDISTITTLSLVQLPMMVFHSSC